MQTKFNYTTGAEFKMSDGITDYIGYFNVDENGNVYQGKYYTDESEILLDPISEYSSDYSRSLYFKDRFPFEILSLPHSLDEILIQPNEIVTYVVLDKKIEYLHNNLLYMYSKMFMGSTDVPVDEHVNTLCNIPGRNTFKWEINPEKIATSFGKLSSVSSLSQYKEFDKMKKFVVIPFEDKTGMSIIGISDTYVIGLTSTITNTDILSNAAFTLYTNVIDNYSQETCKNLEDITFDGEYLFISDSKINGGGQVFRYDVTTYYTNDPMFEGKRFLIEPMGGVGDVTRKNKFNKCTVLGSKRGELWVNDSGNNSLKIYDDNFIWIKTIRLPSEVGVTYNVLDIKHRRLNNHFYVLFQKNYVLNDISYTKFGLFEYDEKYELASTTIFTDILYPTTDIRFNRFCISEQDSNVFYVCTENSIFKKFFSKPEGSFAVLSRSKFYPDDLFDVRIKDMKIISSDRNQDNLYFMGTSFVSLLQERTDYLTVLRDDNVPYYNYNRIKFNSNEYNQSFVINKEFYKIFSNIIQFKNTLRGRFYAEFNDYGDILYKDYIYLTDEEINTLNVELEFNSFINDNELVQPNVINRLFKKIYEFQEKILSLSQVKLKNLKTYIDFTTKTSVYPID